MRIIVVFGMLALAMVAALLALGFRNSGNISANLNPEFDARQAVLDRLRDPGSAQIETAYARGDRCVTGTVNAKNGYGGYSGREPFAYNIESKRVAFGPSDPESTVGCFDAPSDQAIEPIENFSWHTAPGK